MSSDNKMNEPAVMALRHYWLYLRYVGHLCGLRRRAFEYDYQILRERVKGNEHLWTRKEVHQL